MAKYREYIAEVVEQFSGRYLAVGGPFQVVDCHREPVYPVLIEFPSFEQAHRWYNSDQHREPKKLRLASSKSNAVTIAGL